jgi:hypothetical protein
MMAGGPTKIGLETTVFQILMKVLSHLGFRQKELSWKRQKKNEISPKFPLLV